MNRVDLIGFQPPRHIPQDGGTHPRAGEHELPEGLFVEADQTRRSRSNNCVGRLHPFEQWHLSEGVAGAVRKGLRGLPWLARLVNVHCALKHDVKAIANAARRRDFGTRFRLN